MVPQLLLWHQLQALRETLFKSSGDAQGEGVDQRSIYRSGSLVKKICKPILVCCWCVSVIMLIWGGRFLLPAGTVARLQAAKIRFVSSLVVAILAYAIVSLWS